MATTQNVVLVSSSDEDRRRALTRAFRDQWPVRTASDAATTTTSLDASIAVVVIDAATVDLSAEALGTADSERSFYQILWLDGSEETAFEQADAVLDPTASSETLQSTVERLQLRARYDRLLTEFYELAAVVESTDETSATASDREQELNAIKRDLDQVVAQLDDSDAFDIALKERGVDD